MNKDTDFKSLGFATRELYEFPNIVNIEVYRGNCPCSCVHCPVGVTNPTDRQERFGNRGIDLGLYKKIVSEIKEHPHATVRIHSVGEPVIWRDLIEALKALRQTQADFGNKRDIVKIADSELASFNVADYHLLTENGEISFKDYNPNGDLFILKIAELFLIKNFLSSFKFNNLSNSIL